MKDLLFFKRGGSASDMPLAEGLPLLMKEMPLYMEEPAC